MRPGEWELESGPLDDRPTFLAHALALSALHGLGPWPNDGHPLPDEPLRESGEGPFIPSVVLDGVRVHHFSTEPAHAVVEEIVDLLEKIISTPSYPGALAGLHELLARQSAVAIADDLVKELRSRSLPGEQLREVARHLTEHGSLRNTVKLGIVMMGVCGDERDRELLLLLGALEELTLYAVVALMNTQPDRQRAAYELAQRVKGWGRIHAVERLKGCDDPEIKGWLLREGFRNGAMNEYLAHLAATTGDLYMALLEPDVDEALLDGAGGILAALALGGPAQDMTDYDDAVPAMHRYAELASAAGPTLSMLDHLLTIARLVSRSDEDFTWRANERQALAARYEALLARPIWRDLVLAHLGGPVGPYGFNTALSCAGRLDMPVLAQALDQLGRHPFNAYVWQWVLHRSDHEAIDQVIKLATRLLPLDALARGPAKSHGFGPEHAPDRALEVIVSGLRKHPGAGLDLLGIALTNPVIRVRSCALRALSTWSAESLPDQARDWVATAAAAEPDARLRSEMKAFLDGHTPTTESTG